MFKKNSVFKSIFTNNSQFKDEQSIKKDTPFFHITKINKKDIILSENDLKKQLLIVDKRKNQHNDSFQINLLNKIIEQKSPFVFFANSESLFNQAKLIIINKDSFAYIFKNKISFACSKYHAFNIVYSYITEIIRKNNEVVNYNIFREIFYKHTSSIFVFSKCELDFLTEKLKKEQYGEIITSALNIIKPFLNDDYCGKETDFENIFIQKENNFLIYSEDPKFNEFFYFVFWTYYMMRVSTPLCKKEIKNSIFLRIGFPHYFNPERRYFILPDLNTDFSGQKNDNLLTAFIKIRNDWSNNLAFFILYTNKSEQNNFTHSHIGNFITLYDEQNHFEQKIPEHKWE